jgi:hypothetical protein
MSDVLKHGCRKVADNVLPTGGRRKPISVFER